MDIIQTLGLALGASWTAGINLYATVAVLGLLQRFGFTELPGGLEVLGSWWLIGLALFMYAIEFVADKVPYVDSIWDAVHTFVRVPAGAVLALSATTSLSAGVQVVALLLGGSLAFSTHGTKATLRATANASPEPFTNWALSLSEDVLAIGAILFAVFNPVAILFVILIFLLIFAWIFPKVVRRLKRMFMSTKSLFNNAPLTSNRL